MLKRASRGWYGPNGSGARLCPSPACDRGDLSTGSSQAVRRSDVAAGGRNTPLGCRKLRVLHEPKSRASGPGACNIYLKHGELQTAALPKTSYKSWALSGMYFTPPSKDGEKCAGTQVCCKRGNNALKLKQKEKIFAHPEVVGCSK